MYATVLYYERADAACRKSFTAQKRDTLRPRVWYRYIFYVGIALGTENI